MVPIAGRIRRPYQPSHADILIQLPHGRAMPAPKALVIRLIISMTLMHHFGIINTIIIKAFISEVLINYVQTLCISYAKSAIPLDIFLSAIAY